MAKYPWSSYDYCPSAEKRQGCMWTMIGRLCPFYCSFKKTFSCSVLTVIERVTRKPCWCFQFALNTQVILDIFLAFCSLEDSTYYILLDCRVAQTSKLVKCEDVFMLLFEISMHLCTKLTCSLWKYFETLLPLKKCIRLFVEPKYTHHYYFLIFFVFNWFIVIYRASNSEWIPEVMKTLKAWSLLIYRLW
jgi:hypothetical protein